MFVLLSCVSDSQVNTCIVPPVNPPPKGSQLLLVQVPALQGNIPVPAPAPCGLPPTSVSQRMVLQPVRPAPAVQYYYRPDGKLIQLVSINHLKPVNPIQSVQTGESATLKEDLNFFKGKVTR